MQSQMIKICISTKEIEFYTFNQYVVIGRARKRLLRSVFGKNSFL